MRKIRLVQGLAVAVAVPTMVVGMSGSAFAANYGGTSVSWKNVATGRYLIVEGGSAKTVTSNAYAKKWEEKKWSDGAYTFFSNRAFNTGCLDSNAKGSVYVIQCNGGNNQKWYEVKTATGWRLKNKATGRVLDSNARGSVYTQSDQGNRNQRWV
ncbi:RICIN domain-containing protein [Streptomyces sp. NPDC001339]|uniref:RICIN domain-containing protein n=1 Tax=Streptomyces sp. NPDC001339 TaxID=3364563 RepID=UPI003682C835